MLSSATKTAAPQAQRFAAAMLSLLLALSAAAQDGAAEEPAVGPSIISTSKPTTRVQLSPQLPAEVRTATQKVEDVAGEPIPPSRAKTTAFAPTYVRIEDDSTDWTLTGAWSSNSLATASGGTHRRSTTAGDTADLTFSGTWLFVGLVGDRFSGSVEVFIDSVSQGEFDLYRREDRTLPLVFEGLSSGPHTVSLEVTGNSNPLSSGTRVQLDYADYGDGTLLPDGTFEEDDTRLLLSGGWSTLSYAGASGGAYARSSTGAAWFPFAGDSFSLHSLAYSDGGRARLLVDGELLTVIDLYAPVSRFAAESRVFSFEGLGAGPHVLEVQTLSYETAIDRLVTPGSAPFTDPDPPVTGVQRFEADHPSVSYDGVPYERSAQSWVQVANTTVALASAGEVIYSANAGDTISFSFDGEWVGIGLVADRFGGRCEVAIDGNVVDTLDLYSRNVDTVSRYYDGLASGAHAVTITALGTAAAESSSTRVALDYFEVWDGQTLADGAFEERDSRVTLSRGWSQNAAAEASGGSYVATGFVQATSAWLAFTGESITWQGWARFDHEDVELRIDGALLAREDLYAQTEGPRAFSFDNLGAGLHVLEVRQYRDEDATLDVITTPALAAPTPPPAAAPIVRLEEDDPAMRYSGQPYPRVAQSWSVTADQQVSQGYYLSTSAVGDTWRLDFSGVWVALGFRSTATSGTVEIFLDGASQGVFDTANGLNEVRQRVFADLAPGSHTVEAVVVDGTVMPDYIDVWDGAQVNDGWTDLKLNSEPPGLAHLSSRRWWLEIADEYAREDAVLGPFVNIATNAWFNFAGDSVTVLAYEADNTSLEVVIDGVSQGQVLLSPSAPFSAQPRALHFTGLGEGAHTVQVALPAINGARPRIDAFEVNPADTFSAVPEVEWFDDTALETLPGETRTGFISTIGVGDLDGDGLVELVAPSANGRLYVYRGDGQDAGSGSPILWTSDLAGPAAEPAIADLDGDGRAEIIVSGRDGTFAYRHDGQVLWSNTAVTSYFASQDLAWGGPSVANLDLDPEPELVIASIGDAVHVLDAQGNITFSEPLGSDFPTVPVLADLTGDGVLDLIVAETWTLRVIDLFNGGTEVWRRELPDPIVVAGGAGAFGGPAIADLDGDGGAEVIINWGHIVEALESDGSLLWRYETNRTDLYRPSPVTVADVTGDGQPNVVTASAINAGFVVNDHLLQVLDEGGSLVWEQDVADNSASASGVSAQDLTGNGAWEIIWNGAADGFLVFNGADGERLFNEPYTGSGTVLDYPTLADVDGDRQAEVVVAGANGLFVIGHTGRWVDSRPVWNQHNYHINNINGDWSVPFTEENSWEAHNTYRTQTPERDPGCVAVDGALVPPRVVDLTPAGGAVLPAGVSLVVSGRVIPVAPTQPLQDVLIDGRPVDIFDASGSFFSVVSLDAGLNEFTVQAADGCATAEVNLSLTGGGSDDDPWADLADASVLLDGRFSATSFDITNNRVLVDVQADNAGAAIPGPVLMTVGRDAQASLGLQNADGFTPQGEPYVVMVADGATLSAASLSAARELALANSARQAIDFTPRWIAPVNQPPFFTSVPVSRTTTGSTWRYAIQADDGNGDAVTLSLTSGPAGMTLVGGELTWTPPQIGNYEVVITADDGRGATARQGFALQVEDGAFNSPPVFISTPETQRAIGAAYAYAAQASDLDGDTLAYSLTAAPGGATVDSATGAVAWPVPAPGQHSFVLLAADGRGGEASQAWTLYVGEPAVNEPGPAFASVPVTVAAVGIQYRYPWRVTSPLPAAPVVTLVEGPDRMTLDTQVGDLTWVPGGPDLGTHLVELQAVDSNGQTARQRFELTVLAALPNQPPYVVTSPPVTARIGSSYTYQAEAIDPEFETLTWSLATAPAGMTIDSATGLTSWTPGSGQASVAPVTVQVSDPAGGVASQSFSINVRASNQPPQISTVPPTTAVIGSFYSVRVAASDADGDTLTFRLLEAPIGMTLHESLGWLHWTTVGQAAAAYPIRLEVTDGWGGRDELAFDLTLTPDNEAPTVAIGQTPALACRNEPAAVCVAASDNVGLTDVSLRISGTLRPLDASRCYLWTPTAAGVFPAQADAIDPSGLAGQGLSDLSVADCNDEEAPVVTLSSPLPGSTHNEPVSIVASIEDNTPAVLTWTVSLRNPLTGDSTVINTGSGPVTDSEVAVFDPTLLQAGDYLIDILAEDGAQAAGLAVPLAAGTGVKPGRLSFVLRDLVWQLGTFPLVVGRAYDSLDVPLGDGDFSPGWSLVLTGSVTDSAVDAAPGSSGFATFTAEPFTSQTRVNVVKPDGERVGFTFDPQPKSFPAVFQFDVEFKPDSGVTDTLRAVDASSTVSQLGAGFADFVIPYNPNLYELETEDGTVYVLSEFDGLLEVRDPQGGVLTADENGWQSSWGSRVDYERNSAGQLTAISLVEDDSGEIARLTYEYDAQGRLLAATDLGGSVTRYDYGDPAFPNHVTRTLDADGNPVSQMVFDDLGRLIAHCDPEGDPVTLVGCSRFEFPSAGGIETVFNSRGFRIDRFYDENGLLSVRHDYFDATQFVEQRWTYDADGNVTEYRDMDGGVTLSEFDERGNELKRTFADGSAVTWEYGDCDGEWIRQCDALANCSTRTFDDSCRIVDQTDPVGGARQVLYDDRGFVDRLTDEEGQTRAFVYDDRGQVLRADDSLGQGISYEYDALGQLLQIDDRNGDRRTFTFDDAFRLVSETRPGEGTVSSWTYNTLNQVTRATTPGSTLDLTYDPSSRLSRVEHTAAGDPTWWLEYAYDGSGNVTRVTDSAGGVTEYEYDGIDRLISIRQSGAGVLEKRVDFESTPTGLPLVIRRFADLAGTVAGPVTTYTYACAGCGNRLSSIVHSQPDGTVIRELSFTRNALGQVLELTDLDGVHRFSWDGRGWLSDEQHPPASPLPSGATTWDGVGNWLDRPAAAGPANLSYQGGSAGHRLLDDGTFSYSWSGAGQLTVSESLSTGERLLLDYSPEYRIRTMTLENGGGQTLSSGSYIHALTGWRVRSELDGTARHYPHDFENPALALDSSGSVVWRRLYGRAIDRPYAIERNGELRWLLTDMVGTVLAEADTAGQVLADYRYDSFGRQVSGAAPTLDDSLRFAGRDFDLPGGFGYFRARIYDPQNGRFVSEDPLPRWLYQYGDNNPIQYVDPTGESALLEYALFLCDVAGLWVSYRPVGLGVDQGIAVAAAAIAGQPGGSADVYSMIPAPTVPPGTGEGPAGPEIAKSLVLACGSSALL